MHSIAPFLASITGIIAGGVDVAFYTDPGSGTLILQMLIAALVGLMFYVRRIGASIRRMIKGRAEPPPGPRIDADASGIGRADRLK